MLYYDVMGKNRGNADDNFINKKTNNNSHPIELLFICASGLAAVIIEWMRL